MWAQGRGQNRSRGLRRLWGWRTRTRAYQGGDGGGDVGDEGGEGGRGRARTRARRPQRRQTMKTGQRRRRATGTWLTCWATARTHCCHPTSSSSTSLVGCSQSRWVRGTKGAVGDGNVRGGGVAGLRSGVGSWASEETRRQRGRRQLRRRGSRWRGGWESLVLQRDRIHVHGTTTTRRRQR